MGNPMIFDKQVAFASFSHRADRGDETQILGIAPGNSFSLEVAPFKLTYEMMELMGGLDSAGRLDPSTSGYATFLDLCISAMLCCRRHSSTLLALVEIMQYRSRYPCFQAGGDPLGGLQQRLMLDLSEDQVASAVEDLLTRSFNHSGTTTYDRFQLATNGIKP